MSRWNREAALLGIPDLPEGAFRHAGDGKIKPQGGGGGGGHTTSTVTQQSSNIPDYAQGQFMDILGRGEALSQQPYQAYGGERVAQFTPMQRQAFSNMQNQQVAGQVGMGTGLAAFTGMNSFTRPGTSAAYMSPFIMDALAPQLREQARQSQIQGTQQQAEAVGRGAFGGSRDAIMRAERERNLMQQQGDTIARGLQSAFESGQSQFNQEQAQRLQAAGALGQLGQTQFGQEMDITGGLQKLGAEQQAQVQKVLDQQYADFQQQRDFPYQQLGFYSDLLRGAGGTSRSIYSSPQTSPLQTLAGLGTAAFGLGRMATGGEVQRYASGGIASALGDQQLSQMVQQPKTPLMGLAAANELAERQALRAAAPQGIPGIGVDAPQEQQGGELEVLVAELERAVIEGDESKAEVLREIIAERLDPAASGIAVAAPDEVGEFAEGGIVGYEDGGRVKTPLERQREQDRERLAQLGLRAMRASEKAGAAIADVATLPLRGVAGAYDTAVVRPLRALGANAAYLSPYLVPEGAAVNSMTPFFDRLRPPEPQRQMPQSGAGISAAARADDRQRFTNPSYRPTQPQGVPNTGGYVPIDIGGTGGGLAAAARTSSTSTSRVDPTKLPGMHDMDVELQRLLDMAEQAEGADRERLLADAAELEDRIKARGPAQEEQLQRLKGEEAGLDDKRERSKNMAIVEAGLAILSADPSKGAWSAIGTGALQGLRTYKGDVADLEERRQKIFEKMDQIAELRRQEAEADEDKRGAIRSQIRGLRGDAIRTQMSLFKDVGLPIKAAQNKQIFDLELQNRDFANRREIARIGAGGRSNSTLQVAEVYARSKNIPIHQALAELSGKGGDRFDMREAYIDYLKSVKPNALGETNALTFAEFSRMFPPTPISGALPGGATVRP